jgi:hypothetical protein
MTNLLAGFYNTQIEMPQLVDQAHAQFKQSILDWYIKWGLNKISKDSEFFSEHDDDDEYVSIILTITEDFYINNHLISFTKDDDDFEIEFGGITEANYLNNIKQELSLPYAKNFFASIGIKELDNQILFLQEWERLMEIFQTFLMRTYDSKKHNYDIKIA